MKLTIHHFESVDSTNDVCKQLSLEGATEGAIVIANSQTNGRGRRGNCWSSQVGNLYTSLLLTPSIHKNAPPISSYAQLSFLAGLAILKALESFNIENINLKWPNDGIHDCKKLFGILIECVDDGVVIGIGLNINHSPEVSQPTTCLKEIVPAEYDVDVVFHAILKQFWNFYRLWLNEGFETIRVNYLRYALGLNTEIAIDGKTGIFTGISNECALILKDDKGIEHEIVTMYS